MYRIYPCLLLVVIAFSVRAQAETNLGYYRHPAIHDDTIIFVAEGDLWATTTQGGAARRVTSHPGEESHPCISPDGRSIAFAAQYEGPTEVYVMPIHGGPPRRLTVEAEPSVPVTWTPDGKLVYTTRHFSTLPANQLVTINLESKTRTRIPLSQASDATFDPKHTIYFVRPRFHNQQVKRYQGGTARNLWRFEKNAEEATPLTKEIPGESHSPWWHKDRIYFVTDTDGTMNIWSMNSDGEQLHQHTRHSGFDVKEPSLHAGRMVYQVGADLWLVDLSTNVQQKLTISLLSDFDQLREKWITNPSTQLSSAHVHPAGDSVVLVSRGRLFVAPSKRGRLVQPSRNMGLRFRDACFSPDGESILTLSDQTDEFEFWRLSARGIGEPEQLTDDGDVLKWRGYPSPDSKYLAYSDKNNDLWIVDLETKKESLVSSNREGIDDIAWSPDSRWLVFRQTAVNTYTQLQLYDLESESLTALTSERVNCQSPSWSSDGCWLYFLSDRGLESVVGSPWGPRQPEPYFDKPMKIYRLAMKREIRSPFQPHDELKPKDEDEPADKTDEDSPEDEQGKDEQGKDEASTDEDDPQPIEIDLEGIQRRVKPLPVDRGNYSNLASNDEALFWLAQGSAGGQRDLVALALDSQAKPKTVATKVRAFELSANGKKLLIQKNGQLFIVPATTSEAKLDDGKVDLSTWRYAIDVRDDWKQIFTDAWRMHRDYFYDRNMHGINWNAVRRKYEPLVERVTTRTELSDVIGQMVAELSTLHTAVRGGDIRRGDDDVKLPTLGARLRRDENGGGFRIEYIYQSDPDYPSELSPLADPDLNVKVGDVIQSINGVALDGVMDPHLLLREQQGDQVLLQVKSGDESRQVIVIPTIDEAGLRYRDWEYTRRMRVENQSAGSIGYVHLKAMGSSNLTEWYRNFYPVFQRQGLIVDVRHNRGGNIDSIVLEKLMRKAWFYWQGRVGEPTWNMQYAFRGHMVVLCDEHTASDGEAFAEGFRRLGLGKVIGTRTWGGEIWLTSSNRLSDGGIATAAEFGVYGPERVWLIEGHGVDPDIVVDNLPHATFNGSDAQLDAAVRHLQGLIEKDPRPVPKHPDYPDKSFDYP